MKKILNIFFGVSLLAGFPKVSQAGLCAMCRKTLEEGGGAGLIRGFAWSVAVIGGVPLAIAAILFFLFYAHRKKDLNISTKIISGKPANSGG